MNPATCRQRSIGVGGLKIGSLEKEYVNQVLDSNQLSYGSFSKRFEDQFAEMHGCQYGIFCNSGTSALHIAVATLKEKYGWKDGDEILVPAVTFIATSNVVLHNRMRPVFVDVDPQLYNIDPTRLSRHVTSRTRAIIPVHLFGLPASMEPIVDFAQAHNIQIIEDSCETMFAKYQNQSVGSFGDVGCFSTYIAHLLVTGVGGLATTNDPTLATMLRSMMNHGRDACYLKTSDDQHVTEEQLVEIVSKRFSFVYLGHSFRATEIEAAIGLAQLEQIEQNLDQRRRNAADLTQRLSPLQEHIQLPVVPSDRDHVFMMYPILLRHREKTGLVKWLEQQGIETRDMLPLLNQPIYRKIFGDCEARYPIARWINHSGFYVGVHQHLNAIDMEYIAEMIEQYFT